MSSRTKYKVDPVKTENRIGNSHETFCLTAFKSIVRKVILQVIRREINSLYTEDFYYIYICKDDLSGVGSGILTAMTTQSSQKLYIPFISLQSIIS